MRAPSPALVMSDTQREILESLAKSQTAAHREVTRAKALLLAADGLASTAVAYEVGVSPSSVVAWRSRFAEEGLAKLGRVRPGPGVDRAQWRALGPPCTKNRASPTTGGWSTSPAVAPTRAGPKEGHSASGVAFLVELPCAVAPNVACWCAIVPHKLPDKPHWNHGQTPIEYRVPGKGGTSTDDSTGYDQ